MITPAAPSPPPPRAIPPPPGPRRSSTWDGSSFAPGRNLIAASFLQIAKRNRRKCRGADQGEIGGRPGEQRRARVVRAAERPEPEHELGEARRVEGEAMEGVLVERVEREHPPRDAGD